MRYLQYLTFAALVIVFGVAANLQSAMPEATTEVTQPELPVYVGGLAWSPDGSEIAVGVGPETCALGDYSVPIVNPLTGTVVKTIGGGHTCKVGSVDWNSDGTKLLTASDDGTAQIWDVASGEHVKTFALPPFAINQAKWSFDDGLVAAIVGDRGGILIWDAQTGISISEPIGVPPITAIAWHPQQFLLASSWGDGKIHIWNASLHAETSIIDLNSDYAFSLDYSPDGNLLLSGNSSGKIQTRNAVSGQLLRTIQAHKGPVYAVKWSHDGQKVASGGDDGEVKVWDAQNGTLLQSAYPSISYITAISWNTNNKQLAYSGLGSGIRGEALFRLLHVAVNSYSAATATATPGATPAP